MFLYHYWSLLRMDHKYHCNMLVWFCPSIRPFVCIFTVHLFTHSSICLYFHCPFIYPFIHLFVSSLSIYLPIHPFICTFTVHLFTHSSICLYLHCPFIYPFIHLFDFHCPFIYPFIHLFVFSLSIYLPIHPFLHKFIKFIRPSIILQSIYPFQLADSLPPLPQLEHILSAVLKHIGSPDQPLTTIALGLKILSACCQHMPGLTTLQM